MNLKSGLKVLAVIALLLNIGAAIILFGSLKNISQGSNQTSLLSYFAIIAIIVFSFLLFFLFMISMSNRPEMGQNGSNTYTTEDTDLSAYNAAPETLSTFEELKSKVVNYIPKDAISPNEKYSLKRFAEETLIQIARNDQIVEGVFFLREKGGDEFIPIGDYAYFSENKPTGFKLGETLPGQVAKNKKAMNISNVPDNYVKIASGLGKGSPRHLYFLPLIDNEETIAVIEIASFKEFNKESETLFELLAIELSKVLVQLQTRNL